MIRRQNDIDTRNREMEQLAERWELRIHAIALTLTAVVLAMRLVAGRQDLTPHDGWDDTSQQQPARELADTIPATASPAHVDMH